MTVLMAASQADIDAARALMDGNVPSWLRDLKPTTDLMRPDPLKRDDPRVPIPLIIPTNTQWVVPSESYSSESYLVVLREDTVNGGTYLHCSCPSWKFKQGRKQDCKHAAGVRSQFDT